MEFITLACCFSLAVELLQGPRFSGQAVFSGMPVCTWAPRNVLAETKAHARAICSLRAAAWDTHPQALAEPGC